MQMSTIITSAVQDRIRFTVRQMISQYGFPQSDRDDLASELTLAILQAEPNYDAERSKPATFIAMILRHQVLTLIRRRKSQVRVDPLDDECMLDVPVGIEGTISGICDTSSGTDNSFNATGNADIRFDFENAWSQLTPFHRQVCLQLWQGETIQTISQKYGISRTSLYRQLDGIRIHLANAGIAPAHTTAVTPLPRSRKKDRKKGSLTMTEIKTSTYSMWQTFRNCRKACEWRYIQELVPLTTAHALTFGSLVHAGLQHWHQHGDLDGMLALIDQQCLRRTQDADVNHNWQLARAMLTEYSQCYATEAFRVVALESPFSMAIHNPETGKASRTFQLSGKVDGIVEEDGQYFLLEHKTTSVLDGSYLERLWLDMQIILYSHALERIHGIHIAGVIYNVLCKTRLRQGSGETEAEFAVRRAELLAKSKTGKSSAQRKMPESDVEFQQRLQAKYADPTMFHREVILFTPDQYAELEAELWELTQQYLYARRRNAFYRNTSQCFAYGRQCAYYPLCRANGAQHVIDTLYERRPSHEELLVPEAEAATPVF